MSSWARCDGERRTGLELDDHHLTVGLVDQAVDGSAQDLPFAAPPESEKGSS